MCKQHETGWRAISAYTGASIDELRQAVWLGQLKCSFRKPKIKHWRLDAWLFARKQETDRLVDLVLSRPQMAEGGASVDGGQLAT